MKLYHVPPLRRKIVSYVQQVQVQQKLVQLEEVCRAEHFIKTRMVQMFIIKHFYIKNYSLLFIGACLYQPRKSSIK